jgi:hypothetical protein
VDSNHLLQGRVTGGCGYGFSDGWPVFVYFVYLNNKILTAFHYITEKKRNYAIKNERYLRISYFVEYNGIKIYTFCGCHGGVVKDSDVLTNDAA